VVLKAGAGSAPPRPEPEDATPLAKGRKPK